MTVALGLDVGGTKIAAARVDLERGVILAERRMPTAPQRGSDAVHVFELGPEDACYLPIGCTHEYRNAGATTARAICGIAPGYLP